MNQPNLDPPQTLLWEEMHARTDDNLATACTLLKDAGNVTRWSRVLVEKSRQLKSVRAEQKAPPLAVDPVPLFSGETVLVIRLVQNLDLMTSPQLLHLLLRLAEDAALARSEQSREEAAGTDPSHEEAAGMEQSRQEVVVLDLRTISFIDGSGVSVLVGGRKALSDSGMRLMILLSPGSQPERVFEMSKLARIITLLPSLDAL